MIKNIFAIAILIALPTLAKSFTDTDLDGVEDKLDICPNTPFLHTVDKNGCTITILKLPQERDTTSLILTLGYGYTINEDIIGQENQQNYQTTLGFYHNTWSYTLNTGYFTSHHDKDMQDTILKVKKRFSPSAKLKLSLGAGVKLPSYNFKGNKTDFSLYSTLSYYATTSLSYFSGANYTFVRDHAVISPIQNRYNLYLGTGYFLTKRLYCNLSYTYTQGKFTAEEHYQTLSSTIYYKINKTLFTTLNFYKEIDDEDQHAGFSLKLGYSLF